MKTFTLLWILVSLFGESGATTFLQFIFNHMSEYDNQHCVSNWTFPDVRSTVACLARCSSEPNCTSVYFNPENATCLGSDMGPPTPLNLTGCETDTGSKLFTKLTTEPMECVSNSECVTLDTECRGGYCQCVPGYSLVPRTQTCTENCSSYGNTFQHFPGWGLDSDHINILELLSLDECKDACVNETPQVCRSFNYVVSDQRCLTGQLTPITGAAYFMNYVDYGLPIDVDFYLRNCN